MTISENKMEIKSTKKGLITDINALIVSKVSNSLGSGRSTIEDVIEPYLMQLGLIQRTPRGRIVTDAGYRHMGLEK